MEAVGDHLKCSIDGVTDEEINNICEKLILLLQDWFDLFLNFFFEFLKTVIKVADFSYERVYIYNFRRILLFLWLSSQNCHNIQ